MLGLGGAAVTDATIQGNILAVTSHAENVFELHTILLDGPTLEAQCLHREAFKGEVTCLGLCNIAGKPYAVASLWWNSAIYLDFYSIQDKEHVKTIPIQSRKYTTLSLCTIGKGRGKKSSRDTCGFFQLLPLPFSHAHCPRNTALARCAASCYSTDLLVPPSFLEFPSCANMFT